MPYAKTTRRARTRRNHRKPAGVRKRTYKRRTTFRPQKILRVGFPKTTMVKLRYVAGITINPAAGVLGYHDFRANSCYDPDATGVGHQPMNYDMWTGLYNHYVVVGSKITARIFDYEAVPSPFVGGIVLSDDPTITTTVSQMMEGGLTKYKMGYNSNTLGAGNGMTVTKTFSAKKFFNITNVTDNISRLGASVVANPGELAHFMVFVGPLPDNAGDLGSFNVAVTIDYIVIFSEPKEQDQS